MTSTAETAGEQQTELSVTGMTCGACSSRIERKLAKLDGVEASVDLVSGRARVRHDGHDVDEILAVIERLGFGASVMPDLPAPRTAVEPAPAPVEPAPVAEPEPEPEPATEPEPAPREEPAAAAAPEERAAPEDPELAGLRHRALMCLAMTLPVVAISMVPVWQFRYWQWLCLMLAAPVVIWGGWRFHRAAARHLRHGSVTMDTLVSLGSLAALVWSMIALFLGEAGYGGMRHNLYLIPQPDPYDGIRTIYLEVAAAIVTAVLVGRWIELRGRRRALALTGDRSQRPTEDAWLRVGGRELRVPVDNVAVGDEVVVPPGGTVPCDGTVVEGSSTLDTAAMTGESAPAEVGPGTRVLAGTRVGGGRLVVRASHVGDETQWARMRRRVADAQLGKAAVQRLADRISARFVPAVLLLAAYTFLYWWSADAGLDFALVATTAVLVVACPCALGLATPTALAVATGRGAQLGILLRGPETLETTKRVDTVVLDKTGTVTTGVMTVHAVRLGDGDAAQRSSTIGKGVDGVEVARMVAALERDVDHPVARALTGLADTELPTVESAEHLDGLGVRGRVGGVTVLVGRRRLLDEADVRVDDGLAAAQRRTEDAGHTAVLVAWPDRDGEPSRARAVIAVGDTVRETSARAVERLRAMGLRPMLLTGDNAAAAATVAAAVGIDADDVVADVLPTDKADVVAGLQARGRTVAMVGDGVNDAASLAQADLGLAMGAGSAMAVDAADVTLTRNDLGAVPDALRLARRTLRTIRGNLFWAFVYNVAALPLAALGLLNPMVAGVAMGMSSVFVVGNSLRLRRFRAESAVDAAPTPAAVPA